MSTTHSPSVVVDSRATVPRPPSASQSIPVTSDFTNEEIEEFLSNNPELANMTGEQLASGNLEGMDTGSVRFSFSSIFPSSRLALGGQQRSTSGSRGRSAAQWL